MVIQMYNTKIGSHGNLSRIKYRHNRRFTFKLEIQLMPYSTE